VVAATATVTNMVNLNVLGVMALWAIIHHIGKIICHYNGYYKLVCGLWPIVILYNITWLVGVALHKLADSKNEIGKKIELWDLLVTSILWKFYTFQCSATQYTSVQVTVVNAYQCLIIYPAFSPLSKCIIIKYFTSAN